MMDLKNELNLNYESFIYYYLFNGDVFRCICRLLNKCFVDSLLALWKNDLSVIETLTDQSIIDTINTVKFK